MKILLVYPDFGAFGGIERYLLQLVQGLNRIAPELTFVLACTQGGVLQQHAQKLGIQTHGISVPPSLVPLFKKPAFRVFDLGSVWQLRQVVRHEQPDLVHVHIGQLEDLWFRAWGIPTLYTFHGYGALYDWPSTQSTLKRQLKRALTGLFKTTATAMQKVVFVSHAERQRMQAQGYLPALKHQTIDDRFPVIHNGLNVQAWQKQAASIDKSGWIRAHLPYALSVDPAYLQVVSFIDRLDANKNPLLFLDAVDCLLAKHPKPETVQVLVVGDGELAEDVRMRVSTSPYASQIAVLGRRDDIAAVLAVSDLVLHPAGLEGFGLGVLEAMAVGTPCLAWPTGGIAELLDSLELAALKLRDLAPATLAEQALDLLMQTPEDRQALKAHLFKQASLFDESVFLSKMAALYSELV